MAPLVLLGLVFVTACAFAWIASLVTGDNSWVDRLWSLLPVAYL